MDATDAAARVYAAKTGRMRFRAAIAGGFVAAALFVALASDAAPAARALLCAGAAFFGLVALENIRRSLGDAPGLVVNGEGIALPRLAKDVVPWSGIAAIRRLRARRADALSLTLTPEAARRLRRKGLWRLFSLSGRRAPIDLTELIASPDAVVGEIESRWRAAHGFAPNGDDGVAAATAGARPRAVYAILAVLAAAYASELLFPVSAGELGSPSVLTLAYDGGMLGVRILNQGEWWRFFTAPLLHASPTHILFNGIVLWLAGKALESIVGWRWLCGVFAISALCGAGASFALLPSDTVGVGASGAIMGLLAATFVVSFRLPRGSPRTSLQMRMAQTIVPALLPVFPGSGGGTIDYFAHAGGATGGALVAAMLLAAWPRERAEPPLAWAGAIAGAAYFAIAAGALVPILQLRAAG